MTKFKLTNQTYSQNIPGEGNEHKIWFVQKDQLFFNIYNGRIASEMKAKIVNNSTDDYFNDLFQKYAFESLNEICSKNEYLKLEKSIQESGLMTPLVINPNGIIIDGNTRYFLIKKLINEKKINENYQIKAIILSKNYEGIEIENLETKIQFEFTNKIEYSPINKKLKWRSMHNQNLQNGFNENDSFKKIASNVNCNKKDIELSIKVLNYMEKIIQEFNKKINYNFFNKTDGHFNYLRNAEIFLKNNPQLIHKLNDFKKTAFWQIWHGVTLIRSFREIMPNEKNIDRSIWIKNEEIFKSWVMSSSKTNKKEELDEINHWIIKEIKDYKQKKISNLEINAKNNVSDSNEFWELKFLVNRIFGNIEKYKLIDNKVSQEIISKLKKIIKYLEYK